MVKDFDAFVKEQLGKPEVGREYRRLAPFYQLANQLLLLRKKRGLNQQELADKAETTQAVVSRLENATVRCSLETVIRLAEALEAVVEVTLRPVEDSVTRDERVEAAQVDGDDETLKSSWGGEVVFNCRTEKPCADFMMYSIDPITGRLKKPEDKRTRALEYA